MKVMEKIDNAIEKKMMRSGAMGTETVEVQIQLTNDEKLEFYLCDKYDSKNYSWEFEGNTLIISYTELVCTKNYKVIEDNAGGLTLIVFAKDEETIEYIHTGYEYYPGQLAEDLEKLKNGDNPANEWEGNELHIIDEMLNPEDFESWFPWEQEGTGWKMVADNYGIYPENMGTSAKLEFRYVR